MILYVNSKNEIKDVGFTEDARLKPIEADDNIFKGWSVAKICCHKVYLNNGVFAGYSPYVDSRIIEHIDKLAMQTEQNASDVVDTQIAVAETYEKVVDTECDVTDIEVAITELYEMMLGGV